MLRKISGGYAHWCPACEEMHPLPVERGWVFENGDLEHPTMKPSFKHTSYDPKMQGLDSPWKDNPYICHYNVVNGVLQFHNDCTHGLRSTNVTMPALPPHLRDDSDSPVTDLSC